jgi:hypothetical protein
LAQDSGSTFPFRRTLMGHGEVSMANRPFNRCEGTPADQVHFNNSRHCRLAAPLQSRDSPSPTETPSVAATPSPSPRPTGQPQPKPSPYPGPHPL